MKLVIVMEKLPSALAETAVLEARLLAILTLPQGRALVGLLTSDRTPVPVTPIAGAMRACACTFKAKPKARARAMKTLENMAMCKGESGRVADY